MRRGIIEVNKEENRGFVYSALRRPGQREPRLGQFIWFSVFKENGFRFILEFYNIEFIVQLSIRTNTIDSKYM